jgi:hypothetical protein
MREKKKIVKSNVAVSTLNLKTVASVELHITVWSRLGQQRACRCRVCLFVCLFAA